MGIEWLAGSGREIDGSSGQWIAGNRWWAGDTEWMGYEGSVLNPLVLDQAAVCCVNGNTRHLQTTPRSHYSRAKQSSSE